MQRIRYGLTGLAIVFLLVTLGTIVKDASERPAANVSSNEAVTPSDPLAELGVAPGQGTENVTANGAAPKRD